MLRDDRDFRLFWGAYTTSLAGTAVSQLAFPLTALLVLDATPAQVALLVAVGRIPTVLFVLVGGVVADRVRRRRLLVGEQLAGAAIMASIPLAHAFDALTLVQLFAAEIALRTVGAFGAPAFYASVPGLVGRERLSDAIAALRASEVGTGVVGGPAAGALVQAVTAPVAIAVDAVSYVAGAALMASIRAPDDAPERPPGRPSLRHEIAQGARAVVASAELRAMTVADGVGMFVGPGMVTAVYVVYLSATLDFSPALIGFVGGLGGAAALVATRVVGRLRERLGVGRSIAVCAVGMNAATFLLPLAGHGAAVPVVLASAVLGSAAAIPVAVNFAALRQLWTPPALLGRVGASMRFLLGVGVVAGAGAASALTELVGVAGTIWAAAGLQAALVVYLLASPLVRVERLPVEAAAAEAS